MKGLAVKLLFLTRYEGPTSAGRKAGGNTPSLPPTASVQVPLPLRVAADAGNPMTRTHRGVEINWRQHFVGIYRRG